MKEMIEKLSKNRIGVLAGGPSSEREISLKSGKAVFEALKKLGLDVSFVDVNDVNFSRDISDSGIDLAFIALHGNFGEDGTVQRLLTDEGIAYTGSRPDSSKRALDKIVTKQCFAEQGVKTPEFKIFSKGDVIEARDLWSPCVIKPRYEGSSIGLTIAFNAEDVKGALDLAFNYSDEVMIEEYIAGRELTVGILQERPLPVVEIITVTGVYDYNAKYVATDTRYVAPAELTESMTLKLQEAGLKAHEALGCSGFSRVDIRLSEDDDIYVLEVNTIPGLTERSLLPMAASAAGISFPELCLKILMSANTE